MAKAQSAGVGAGILRLWWVILLAALIGGAVAFAAADRSTTEQIYGVVNVRPVAALANDRIDLVEDLNAALTLPSVLSAPAKDAGMSVSDLRRDLTVQTVGETSFVRVGVAVHDGDDAAAEAVLRAVVASAAGFLSGDAAATADDPLAQEVQFTIQRVNALVHELETLPADSPTRADLESERDLAKEHRKVLEQRQALAEDEREDRRVDLPLTMQGEDLTRGGSATQLRRAAAGAAVGGLIAALVIAGFSLGGRRRRTS